MAPIVCMFTTLEQMELRVHTAFGDSEETCGGEFFVIPFDHPPQGVGQGNRASL